MARLRRSRSVGLIVACAVAAAGCLADLGERSDLVIGFHIQGGTETERELALEHGAATTNHGISWNVLEPSPNDYDFRFADAAAQWAGEHDLHVTAMHFAWDQALLDDVPDWVLDIDDATELRGVLERRAATIFGRYPDIDRIVVVNEPLDVLGPSLYANHFFNVLGPDYIAELFGIVSAAAPSSTELILNENLIEYSQPKADALVALVSDLVEHGAAIDGVGLQSHLLLGEPDWRRYRTTMEQIAALDLDIHVTEFDAPVEPALPDRLNVQAQRYHEAVSACLAVTRCRSFTFWGVTDAHTWIDDFIGPGLDPLLFDADGSGKPAFLSVVRALGAGRP